jgi:hypothetical protein
MDGGISTDTAVKAALGIGLTLVAVALVVVLSGSPVRVEGPHQGGVQTVIGQLRGEGRACQAGRGPPAGASAIRFDLEAVIGPSVAVTVEADGRVLTSGTRSSGWTGADVTVPIRALQAEATHATICLSLGPSREVLTLLGSPGGGATATQTAEGPVSGRLGIEYLAAGDRSWWSQVAQIAHHIGLGRSPSGTWIAFVLLALMATAAALACWLALRQLGASTRSREPPGRSLDPTTPSVARTLTPLARMLGPVPAAAWVCALVACLNAACWSILSPPFQAPDEPAHFAFVQQLAEAQRLPVGASKEFSPEEETALADLHHSEIQFMPSAKTISTSAEQDKLEHDLAAGLSRRGPGETGTSANEPPLYYALEVIPYEIGAGGTILERLQLMRLLSAVFGGLTALFAFLFVREALPGTPWAWTVAGLGVALTPLLGFASGSVNPDALLATESALLFFLFARAFRRGLTPRLGGAIGGAICVGLITKLNFLGLAPGAILGLILLALRATSQTRRAAYTGLALALAIVAVPALIYLIDRPLINPASVNLVSTTGSGAAQGGRILSELSYIWQLYLPRLPGMTNYFPGLFTSRQLWFDGVVGLYGWVDTVFPAWVDTIALVPAGLLALLCLRALIATRALLRRRLVELGVYAAIALGLLALVGAASYSSNILNHEEPFWEPRYLLPLLPLLGLALALAARGAGRRWGPPVGALIVVLFLAHDLFSQLLVVSRYYS